MDRYVTIADIERICHSADDRQIEMIFSGGEYGIVRVRQENRNAPSI